MISLIAPCSVVFDYIHSEDTPVVNVSDFVERGWNDCPRADDTKLS